MADNCSSSRLIDRELRVKLERETPKWSKQDKKIIAFANNYSSIFKRRVVRWKKGDYEKIFNNLWNSDHEESVDTSALSQRWLVIKNLYLNYKVKKINLNSKYFDGRLSFLTSKKRKRKRNSRLLKNFVKASISATSDGIKTQKQLISKPYSDAKQNDKEVCIEIINLIDTEPLTDSTVINAPKYIDNFTDPTKINTSKNSKTTTQSSPEIASDIEIYKPGSLVSGAYLEVQPDLKKLTECETLYLYHHHFARNLNDEKFLLKKNVTSKSNLPVSSSTIISVEEALATISNGNEDLCEESITLYSGNADKNAAITSIAVKEVKQKTSSNELGNDNVLVSPNDNTRDFFRGIGKYVANKYPDQKQNEILLEVCSLITAAELQLLGDDE